MKTAHGLDGITVRMTFEEAHRIADVTGKLTSKAIIEAFNLTREHDKTTMEFYMGIEQELKDAGERK